MDHITIRAIKKASSSPCRYKIAAIGFNRKNEVIGIAYNTPRFSREGGSIHAEINLLKKCGKKLYSVMILRIGGSGNILPIDPCENCRAALQGIRIFKHRPYKKETIRKRRNI